MNQFVVDVLKDFGFDRQREWSLYLSC